MSKQPARGGQSTVPHGVLGQPLAVAPTPRAPVTQRTTQTLRQQVTIRVVMWGKDHELTPREFKERSGRIHAALAMEREILIGALRDIEDVLESLDSRLMNITLGAVDAFKSVWTHLTESDPQAASRTIKSLPTERKQAIHDAIAEVRKEAAATHPDQCKDSDALLALGLANIELRKRIDALRRQLNQLSEALADAAGAAADASQSVADAALETLVKAMNPIPMPGVGDDFREAAYRIMFLFVEAAAREASAASVGGKFGREVRAVCLLRLGPIMTPPLTGLLERTASFLTESTRRQLAEALAGVIVGTVVEFLDFLERPTTTEKFQKAILERGLASLSDAVIKAALGHALRDSDEAHRALVIDLVTKVVQRLEASTLRARESSVPPLLALCEGVPSLVRELMTIVGQHLVVGMVAKRRSGAIAGQRDARPPAATNGSKSTGARNAGSKKAGSKNASSTPTDVRRLEAVRARCGLRSARDSSSAGSRPAFRYLPPGEAQKLAHGMGLSRAHLERLRRVAWEDDLVIIVRASKPAAAARLATPGRAPKPLSVKAKTRGSGDLAGLVVVDDAKDLKGLREHGLFVRPDGLLFRTDLAVAAARARAHPKSVVDALAERLEAFSQQHGRGRLESAREQPELVAGLRESLKAISDPDLRASVLRVHDDLARGPVMGFTSDLDLYEVIDRRSGRRVTTGSGDMNDPNHALDARNRERLNARAGGSSPHAEPGLELFQHGGATEARDADGNLAHPNLGHLVIISGGVPRTSQRDPTLRSQSRPSDEKVEAWVEENLIGLLGDRYVDRKSRANGPSVDLTSRPHSALALDSAGVILAVQALELGAKPEVALKLPTEPEPRQPDAAKLASSAVKVSLHDLQFGQIVRGLLLVHPSNAWRLGELCSIDRLVDTHQASVRADLAIAVDPDLRIVLISCTCAVGIVDALKRLDGFLKSSPFVCEFCIGPDPRLELRLEIVLDRSPRTFAHVMDALELVEPSHAARVPGLPEEVRSLAAAATRDATIMLRAGRTVPHDLPGTMERLHARALEVSYASRPGISPEHRPVKLEQVPLHVLLAPIGLVSRPLEAGDAIVAPLWLRDFDLQTEDGLDAALAALGRLDLTRPDRSVERERAIQDIQSHDLGRSIVGTLDDQTRKVIREKLAADHDVALIAKAASTPKLREPGPAPWPFCTWPVRDHLDLTVAGKTGKDDGRFGCVLTDGRKNTGIDIAAPVGTQVMAVAPGVVAVPAPEPGGLGKWLRIDHGEDRTSVYANLEAVEVQPGQLVRRGEVIGAVGPSLHPPAKGAGRLHVELREGRGALDKRVPVDPIPRLDTRDALSDPSGRTFTRELLRSVVPRTLKAGQLARVDNFADALESARREKDMVFTNPKELAAFVAQVAHESESFQRSVESLNYSVDALERKFSHRLTAEQRELWGRSETQAANQEMIANALYGDRLGNRGRESGDGWRYRGRGAIQLTGRDNYQRAGRDVGQPYGEQPELLQLPSHSARAALWFWRDKPGLRKAAQSGNIDEGSRLVNGGTIGLTERRELYVRVLNYLRSQTEAHSETNKMLLP